MKTTFITGLALLLLGCFVAQAGIATLVVNNDPTKGTVILSNAVSVAANETAVIKSIGPQRMSDNSPAPNCLCTLAVGGAKITYSYLNYAVGQSIAGPAQIQFYTLVTDPNSGNGPATGFMTVETKPEAFPPGQTIILPQGTVGVIHVESSTNLIQWQDEWFNTFSNTNQNRFFRLRAERSQ